MENALTLPFCLGVGGTLGMQEREIIHKNAENKDKIKVINQGKIRKFKAAANGIIAYSFL